jgi:SSS family transporter
LNALDTLTLLGYAAMLVGIALYHSRKIHARDDYLLAGRSMSRWPIALSMYVALFSTNTFVGVIGWVNRPEGTLWIGLQNIGMILAVPLVVRLYPGLYYRLRISTAYEYLEMRFDYRVRAMAGLLFIGARVMWMATMLYAGGLVISQMLGWTPGNGVPQGQLYAILLLGGLGMFFGLAGGMHAVIWTDVAQFFVLFGSVAAMVGLSFALSGGPAHVLSVAVAAGKLAPPRLFSLTDDLSVVSGLCLGFISMLASAGTDQVILQTYLTAKSEREAKGSLWYNGFFLKPLSLVFPVLGAIIFVYFHEHPQAAAPMRVPDDALAVFVLNVLPGGVRGLAIAALMSALLTSLAGGMAALTACVQVDFIQRGMKRTLSGRDAVRLGRALMFAWGVVIVSAAVMVMRLGKNNNIIQILNIVMYPFTGVLLGVFLLALLARRANGRGALIGAAAGFLATIALPISGHPVSNFFYGAIGALTTLALGYAASLQFGGKAVHEAALHPPR